MKCSKRQVRGRDDIPQPEYPYPELIGYSRQCDEWERQNHIHHRVIALCAELHSRGPFTIQTVARRNFKSSWVLGGGLVQDHPAVRAVRYDFNSSDNIVMMPGPMAFRCMDIRRDRPVHYGGHNIYVGVWLDHIQKMIDELETF